MKEICCSGYHRVKADRLRILWGMRACYWQFWKDIRQIYIRHSDIDCQSICTARFIVATSSCRRHVESSTKWRQSLFCCCTASMEQPTDGAETAANDGLVSSWSENISVSFCLQAPGYGLTLWCALGFLVEGAIQVPRLLSTDRNCQ